MYLYYVQQIMVSLNVLIWHWTSTDISGQCVLQLWDTRFFFFFLTVMQRNAKSVHLNVNMNTHPVFMPGSDIKNEHLAFD